ncbi:amidase family protein [Henriciella sp.]|uniref:amidase family protein n=1 Tax=Henriciella sp. TaxID=1968823 RepID=UPI002603E5CB|nr:amidase family protein [Henriciella sp.]
MTRTVTDLGSADALETADLVRRKEVSALEVCDAAIDRIERLDNAINAVVVRDFERARKAARSIDANLSDLSGKPLLGVAMTVKESNDMTGLPTTWGMEAFADYRPDTDALAVKHLKDAGAVIVGKTNAPVALADWQSFNPVYGRTVNPHDTSRTPGGSSGGSSAALAAGMVPLELGSDIGGSIRAPAHFCGIFGHKPTYGAVSLKGHALPGTDGVEVPLAVVGPMARSARDLDVAFTTVAGPAGPGWTLDLAPARKTRLEEYRVLVLPADGLPRVAGEVSGAINRFAERLDAAGCDVRYETGLLPDIMVAHEHYVRMLNTVITRGTPEAKPIDAHQWMELLNIQMRLQRRWDKLFGEFDTVLAPIASMTAFPHADQAIWSSPPYIIDGEPVEFASQLVWAGLATFPGLPATAIPLEVTKEGLPTGVQALGPQFGDRTTLFFAEQVEKAGLCLDPATNIPAG